MRKTQTAALALAPLMVAGLVIGAAGCGGVTLVGSAGLIGTWTGTLTLTTTATPEGGEPNTATAEIPFTLVIGEDGLPTGLPLFGQPGDLQLTAFQQGQTGSYEGPVDEEGSVTIAITLTVVEARFEQDSFCVVYDIDFTLSVGDRSARFVGRETYRAELQDGKLAWDDDVDLQETTTVAGEDPTNTAVVSEATGQLTRQ